MASDGSAAMAAVGFHRGVPEESSFLGVFDLNSFVLVVYSSIELRLQD